MFHVIAPIRFSSERDAAEREVDACGQTHGGNDDAELARLCERFDDTSASPVAQTTMVIRDPVLEHFCEVLADQLLLIETERERIGRWQMPGEFRSQRFGCLTSRS